MEIRTASPDLIVPIRYAIGATAKTFYAPSGYVCKRVTLQNREALGGENIYLAEGASAPSTNDGFTVIADVGNATSHGDRIVQATGTLTADANIGQYLIADDSTSDGSYISDTAQKTYKIKDNTTDTIYLVSGRDSRLATGASNACAIVTMPAHFVEPTNIITVATNCYSVSIITGSGAVDNDAVLYLECYRQ